MLPDTTPQSTVPLAAATHLREVEDRLRGIRRIADGDGLEDVSAEERLFFVGKLTDWARVHLAAVREWVA